MKRFAFTAVALAGLAGCAGTPMAVLPDNLKPADREMHSMTVAAKGVQIYECRPGKDGATTAWTFVAPDAGLFDSFGRTVGHHGAGPSWQANDGSRVVGSVKARADAPRTADIPWLLLATKSAGPQGVFSGVTSIQRVNTVGGIAPSAPCAPGTQARVEYLADYRLFVDPAAARAAR